MRVHWIKRRDQIEALSTSIRQNVADRLSAIIPCSVATLASALSYKPTALYQHLAALWKVGLVRTLPPMAVSRGRPAVDHQMIAPLVRWARAPRAPSNRPPMIRAAQSMANRAATDHAVGFTAPHRTLEGPGRNHWIFRLVARPSKQRLKRINALLDEFAFLAYTPDPQPDPLVSIACLLAPVPKRALTRVRRASNHSSAR